VDQPTLKPTRKLAAATVAAFIVALAFLVTKNLWPAWADPVVFTAATPIIVFLVGYFIRDEANV
jgi:hypothetical protein